MENSMEITGERFIPESNDEELEIEHLQRYYCIQKVIKDKIVLDAACGEGYGSHLLSIHAEKVIGVDIDEETIQHAKRKYGESKKLNYICSSVTDLNMIEAHSVDVAVSFETIEHIDGKSQMEFLSEIYRVLKKDGILIMSTPNKAEYTDRYDFHNKFHIKEFYIEEFINFLNMKFINVCIYNQYLEVASFVDREELEEDTIQYCVNRERYNPVPKYVIAVASNAELPTQSISMAFMHLRREYMPILDELNYCRREAITCREKIKILENINEENKQVIDKKNNDIRLNEEELERRAVELEHRMEIINNRDGELGRTQNEVKLLNEELERRAVELEHRMDEINRRNSEVEKQQNEIKLLNEELERRANELDHRMQEINCRDDKINRQNEEIRILNEELEAARMEGIITHIKNKYKRRN